MKILIRIGLATCFALQLHALQIDSFDIATTGVREAHLSTATNAYYILYRGIEVTNVSQPIALAFGTGSSAVLIDTNSPTSQSFYTVREVLRTGSLDLDADGISDVFELTYPACLNPLDGTDGTNNCDGDVLNNLQEFQAGTDPTVPNVPVTGLVINEVDYDQIGTDSAEFVEIFNPTASSISLASVTLVLVNGTGGLEYSRVNLAPAGSINSGQYLVVSSTNVAVPAGALQLFFSVTDNNVQNGAPDGIALIDRGTLSVIDALSYGGSVTAASITNMVGPVNLVEGTALSASVADSNTSTGSLIRSPNGSDSNNASVDWVFTATLTPGSSNP